MNSIMVYTFAIIILVWILVILTSRLLSGRRKRSVLNIRKFNAVYVFILFFMIVFMLLIMMEFYQGPTITLTNKDNFQITVKEKVETKSIEYASNLDSSLVYIDDNHGFYFTLPRNSDWSKPKTMNGLMAYMEKTGLETNKANAELYLRWNPYREILQCVFADLKMNPYEEILLCFDKTMRGSAYGNMMRLSYSTQIEYGKPIEIKITNTGNSPFSNFSRKSSSQESLRVPENQNDSTRNNPDPALKSLGSGITTTSLNFINYFNVTVFDKTQIPEGDNRFTIANYFLQNTVNLASNVEKIIASEDNILLAFSFKLEDAVFPVPPSLSTHLSDEQVEKETQDITIHRWGRMIEDSERLYVLEMAYSPETDDERSSIWNNLKTIFESFTVLIP